MMALQDGEDEETAIQNEKQKCDGDDADDKEENEEVFVTSMNEK